MNRRFTVFAQRIVLMIVVWMVFSNLYLVFRFLGIYDKPVLFIPQNNFFSPSNEFHLGFVHIQSTIAGAAIGFLLAFADFLIPDKYVRQKPFGYIIVFRSIVLIVAFLLATGIAILGTYLHIGMPVDLAFRRIFRFYLSKTYMSILLYGALVSFLINFYKQMTRKFGPGMLLKLLTGKYHQPQVEERIFMFMDMKDSTTHAERLGHLRYSRMIQDCVSDLTKPVLRCRAEVYQYIGDEVILTWPVQQGFRDGRCVRLYFDFCQVLNSRATYYKDNYGLVPYFKAGMDAGLVTVAEVGEIKREISYYGDVLNTAARLQSKCNELGRAFLISENVFGQLPGGYPFQTEVFTQVALKGKEKPADLYSISLVSSSSVYS